LHNFIYLLKFIFRRFLIPCRRSIYEVYRRGGKGSKIDETLNFSKQSKLCKRSNRELVAKSRFGFIPKQLVERDGVFWKRFLGLICSLFIVAGGQPAWIPFLCPVAAALGYALFWICCAGGTRWQRFWLATLWSACVQLVQLSWMTSIAFQGYYILFVYAILSALLGLQFGFFNLFLGDWRSLSSIRLLAGASLWTVIEWSRLFVLCGFSLNPVGLSLSAYLPSLQFAAIWGIYGLSFWVMLTNLILTKAYFTMGRGRVRLAALWLIVALIPTLFGLGYLKYDESCKSGVGIHAALVQTGLLPSEKVPLPNRHVEFISPYEQWSHIFRYLKEENRESWDLIVLPEAVVPIPAQECVYLYSAVLNCIELELGERALLMLPPLSSPFAEKRLIDGKQIWCVSNAFWAQSLSNFYRAEVVIGLDHEERESGKNYNAAFHFLPFCPKIERYDKRVLLPLAEYLPFAPLKSLTQRYGISAFFSHGKEAKVFNGRIPMSVSICYEETFPGLIRKGRLNGAELLVNVTNDNYYPTSRLPKQHFDHARLRPVETGAPLLRACNSGVTGAVDSCGRILGLLSDANGEVERVKGALTVFLKMKTHSTLYRFWGDAGIIGLSCTILVIFCSRIKILMRRS
jgi:apolipoprotein N-acyltransferase